MGFHQGEPLRNMGNLPDMGADRYPNHTSFIHQDEEVTYEELDSFGGRVNPERDFEDPDATTGETAVRGPQVFEGYHNLPEATEEVFDDEGWFYTQDITRVDENGFLWMVGRYDDMIIAGGENIYPTEVEE